MFTRGGEAKPMSAFLKQTSALQLISWRQNLGINAERFLESNIQKKVGKYE
jgi:hypothetical protein